MTGFLQKIAGLTAERVAAAKLSMPKEALEDAPLFMRPPGAVKTALLRDDYNIIAEVKFASPSEGTIREQHDPVGIAKSYLANGAAMLSVLTEPLYFKGTLEYLKDIRNAAPDALLLRKDFMVDTYQLLEARAAGADAILIILAMTSPEVSRELFDAAKALALTPLIEVHDEDELAMAIEFGADVIGVNNRNLKTLKTDLDISRRLSAMKPKNAAFVCESGLSTATDLQDMRGIGYNAFLMGTHFMRKDHPGAALRALREELPCA
ncbi:MAG: indole-3-glycerol phosphate synthase TrpC [Micavibrio sp.]|nr:indole-3-glycerol phosphate synthase TrpC [Micavibrio sp.]